MTMLPRLLPNLTPPQTEGTRSQEFTESQLEMEKEKERERRWRVLEGDLGPTDQPLILGHLLLPEETSQFIQIHQP